MMPAILRRWLVHQCILDRERIGRRSILSNVSESHVGVEGG
jgi:hypothetical protein